MKKKRRYFAEGFMRVEGQCHCGANVGLISLKVHNIKLL